MIDPDLINELPDLEAYQVKLAFATIGMSGVIGLMESRLLERLADGARDEDDQRLMDRIRLHRQQLGQIRELQHLCDTCRQDTIK